MLWYDSNIATTSSAARRLLLIEVLCKQYTPVGKTVGTDRWRLRFTPEQSIAPYVGVSSNE